MKIWLSIRVNGFYGHDIFLELNTLSLSLSIKSQIDRFLLNLFIGIRFNSKITKIKQL